MSSRVGFLVNTVGGGWQGGLNYIANLVQAIQAGSANRIEPVLFTSPGSETVLAAMMPSVEVVPTQHVAGRSARRVAGKVLERATGRNYLFERLLRSHRIDVLSHFPFLGRACTFPTIAWIPDLQHRQRPDFFDPEELLRRDASIVNTAAQSTTVLVSSNAALHDLTAFIPSAERTARVLHFVSGLDFGRPTPPLMPVLDRYGLPHTYFHLPNQFWRHKNHRLVIDALSLLAERGFRPHVVSTGACEDYRSPDFFNSFKAYLSDKDIVGQFHILGLIPYEEVRLLMANSIAVINPSLFEGWSTSVEEGKSLGKAILLSDIAVHREQAPPRGLFFDPYSAEELANAMIRTSEAYLASDEELHAETARLAFESQFASFGAGYADIVADTIRRFKPRVTAVGTAVERQ